LPSQAPGPLRFFLLQYYLFLAREFDPSLYGVGPARFFRSLFTASLVLTPLLLAFTAYYSFRAGLPFLAALAWLPLLVSLAAPRVWRLIVGYHVDQELPALLTYMLPFTYSNLHIADVLMGVRLVGEFPWAAREAERLRVLVDLAHDPHGSLKMLASTTPSRGLRLTLEDYIHAQTLGAGRAHLTLTLFRRALDSMRDSWRSHVEFSRLVAEGLATLAVALVAVTPVAILGGTGGVIAVLAWLPVIAAPAGAIVILLNRPALGELRAHLAVRVTALQAPFVAATLALTVSLEAGIAWLLGWVFPVEFANWAVGRRAELAERELRRAVDEARLGIPPVERLKAAEELAGGVLRAILKSARVAGMTGVWEALSLVYTLVAEARSLAGSARTQGLMMSLILAAIPALSIFTLKMVSTAVAESEGLVQAFGFNLQDVAAEAERTARIIAAASPLIPLPAAVLHRGWTPSPIPSLLAITLATLTLYRAGI